MKASSQNPIVIVDDDDDDHYFFRKICQRLQVPNELIFFSNAQDALQYLKLPETNPHLLLCDINMPLMNGLELRKYINEDEILKEKSTPFIFFSTAASHNQVREAYRLNVQGFFLKGQSFEEIEITLRRVIDYWELCQYPRGSHLIK
ncbi:MAG TPA: response regulator [Ohtaekwangia sp.]|uniref:response regulator n=1 Tax=Ohtaekwangia sp. TaxID=2066019 RepID=UPI002F93FC30